jgi:hypothetical protein
MNRFWVENETVFDHQTDLILNFISGPSGEKETWRFTMSDRDAHHGVPLRHHLTYESWTAMEISDYE